MKFNPDELLLPCQSEWLSMDMPIKAWEKSRRIGASWTQAGDDALYVSGSNSGNAWYMGQDKEMAQAYVEDVIFWATEVYK
ncbi:MAG: hypothetical protein GY862_22695, partial [Gammaproteobacteria bacterium]|nr:hypothetical protein [Gammaproteobacteria bacterium]